MKTRTPAQEHGHPVCLPRCRLLKFSNARIRTHERFIFFLDENMGETVPRIFNCSLQTENRSDQKINKTTRLRRLRATQWYLQLSSCTPSAESDRNVHCQVWIPTNFISGCDFCSKKKEKKKK